ncbi:16S rRNA (cytosine(967)-C(5))-methyltransferase [Salipaludibacillus neizhouensis]|uniref:16S rRNA (cytosine(967)-C(5))-methyltransferase n=1 Tax=Salipaludibacillus neizhouensis TaxID=885475 RepID=A0A3A9KWJ7_9BACI|nr:16S rRNA (cytosine(967)-C(5))-methyltransferase RsmB [Salipaludibacillus neizhouensis]RKL68946.1 16S rRNA (cytosine(967)-C(5))-methyltransferase [Salipaludibacillus neizhouensis]
MSKKKSTGNVREAALEILLKIKKNQAYSNLLLNDTIKKENIASIDVPLLTEIVYGTIQYQKRIDFYLEAYSKKPLVKIDDWVHILWRLTVYQLIFLDRVPDHAAINEAVEISKKRGHKGISGMTNGILRSFLRHPLPEFSSIKNETERLAVETSHPEWLLKRWSKQYGAERASSIAFANLTHPTHSVRVNTNRVTKEEVMESLQDQGLEVKESPYVEECLYVKKGSLANTKAFENGWISIQDEGSMLVTLALDPQQGESILDACAAPGGKSMHIAERMQNIGEVVSIDIHSHKVKLIHDQAKRLELSIVHGEVADARQLHEKYDKESFDRILVDAPCSGLGVIQRKPDLKWSKKEEDIHRLSEIQQSIVEAVWPLLKKGGRLVYSTCTVDREENDDVVTAFVEENEEAIFDDQLLTRIPGIIASEKKENPGYFQLFPGEFRTDGFFISAILKRE